MTKRRVSVHVSTEPTKHKKGFNLYTNACGESHEVKIDNDGNKSEEPANFEIGVIPSKIEAICEKLNNDQNLEPGKLKAILEGKFYYQGVFDSKEDNGKIEEEYEYHTVFEALIFQRPSYLLSLIDRLEQKRDPLHLGVLTTMLHDPSDKDMFGGASKSLLLWNKEQYEALNVQIDALESYGQKMQGTERDKKMQAIASTVHNLREKTLEYDGQYVSADKKVRNLKFKLEMIEILHHNDKAFQHNRGYGNLIKNIIFAIVTLGLCHLARAIYTRGQSVAFFRKQTTVKLAKDVDSQLGLTWSEQDRVYRHLNGRPSPEEQKGGSSPSNGSSRARD